MITGRPSRSTLPVPDGKKRTPSYVDLPWRDMRAAFIERGWFDANQRRHEFRVGNVRLAVAGVDDPHHDFDDYDEIAGAPNPDADLALALLHSLSHACYSALLPTATSSRCLAIRMVGKCVCRVPKRW